MFIDFYNKIFNSNNICLSVYVNWELINGGELSNFPLEELQIIYVDITNAESGIQTLYSLDVHFFF